MRYLVRAKKDGWVGAAAAVPFVLAAAAIMAAGGTESDPRPSLLGFDGAITLSIGADTAPTDRAPDVPNAEGRTPRDDRSVVAVTIPRRRTTTTASPLTPHVGI